jgi:hypothetical protein
MAASDLTNTVLSAKEIHAAVQGGKSVPAWAFEYIAVANDHLESVKEYMATATESIVKEATGHPGYDNMLKVLQAVEAGEDAHFDLAGEPITLEYPEARFLGGKYKAFLKAGRQEEFLKYMNDPVMFDRLMLQLRQLIDKQKNFKGSVQGQRGVEEAAQSPYAIGMAAAKKKFGYGDKPAQDLPKKVIKKAHEIGDKIKADEAYSMADVRRDAEAQVKKDIDSASDARIAGTKKKKDEPFMAQVGRKIIGGVSGAVKGAAKGFTETADGEYYCNVDRRVKAVPEGYKKLASGYITRK